MDLRLLFSVLVAVLFCGVAQAKDIVLVSQNGVDGDGFLKGAQSTLLSTGLDVEIREIFGIVDIDQPIKIDEGDRIVGFIMHAHGTKKSIALHPTKATKWVRFLNYFDIGNSYSGQKFADHLAKILPANRMSENFFVWIYSCSTAGVCLLGENFQSSFAERFKYNLIDVGIDLKRLLVFAFPTVVNSNPINRAYIDWIRATGTKELDPIESFFLDLTSEDSFNRWDNSPIRKWFNWFIVPMGAWTRVTATIGVLALLSSSKVLDLHYITSISAFLGIHVWAFYNMHASQSGAVVKEWTPEKQSQEKGYIHKLLRKITAPLACSEILGE